MSKQFLNQYIFLILFLTNVHAIKHQQHHHHHADAKREEINEGEKRRIITIHEFNDILATEIGNEFGLNVLSTSDTDRLWEFASSYEWSRAKHFEEEQQSKQQQQHYDSSSRRRLRAHSSQEEEEEEERRMSFLSNPSLIGSYPFVVCSMSYGTPGYSVKQQVEGYFGQNNIPLYNKVDKTCFLTTTTASLANNASSSLFNVHPLLPEAKLQEDTIDVIKYGESFPTSFFVVLSPGWSSNSKQQVELLANHILTSIQQQQDGSSGRNLAVNTFLRQQQYDDDLRRRRLLDPFLHGREHKRALLWLDSFDNGINSDHQCHHILSKVIIDGSVDGDSFGLDFPTSDNDDNDHKRACLLSILAGLSTRPEICSIGINPEMELANEKEQWVTQSGIANQRPWFDVGLTGKGQIVAVSDSGLDTDNCYFWDKTGDIIKNKTAIDRTRRKVVRYYPNADTSDYYNGHGTHVVATVAGHRAQDGLTETEGQGNGIAKDAKVAFVDLGGQGEKLSVPMDPTILLVPGQEAGSNIHSASWCSPFNGYAFSERKLDDFMFRNENFLMVIAAGNKGSKLHTIGSPATCKNGISVGATEAITNGESDGLSKDSVAFFSGRGPTADGRIKPDVVAPGYGVVSAGARPDEVGECDETLNEQSGTSMATPVVSGTAALIRQYFEDGWFPTGSKNPSNPTIDPSASLVKAVLLNGGQEVHGAQSRWYMSPSYAHDMNQGFGRINLLESLPLAGKNDIRAQIVNNKPIFNFDVDVITVTIDKSNGCMATELSATLVWTDPPAMAHCRACVLNDLDLRVVKNDGRSMPFYPNGLDGPDVTNNVERVRVSAGDGDKFDIIVEGRDLEEEFQKYSLVVTGCLSGQSSAVIPSSETEETTSTGPTTTATSPTTVLTSRLAEQKTTTTTGSSLKTTFEGQEASHGNMFQIEAKKSMVIKSIDINLDSSQGQNVPVQVWTTGNELDARNARSSSNGWVLVASTNVRGNGVGHATTISPSYFSPVSLGAGDVASFYVASPSPAILTSLGTSFGSVTATNDDVSIKEGMKNEFPFGDYDIPYVWNGILRYDDPNALSLSTKFDHTNECFGNMFDVRSFDSDILITGMDIHTSSTRKVSLEIYIKVGSYRDNEYSSFAWTLVGSGDVQGFGQGRRTFVPPELFFQDIIIRAGSTVAFYVTSSSSEEEGMLLLCSSSFFVGSYSNANLEIHSGAAKKYPFGESHGPSIWNGALRYEIL